MTLLHQATGVAVDGRGVLIEGAPGIGKTSLALALIDRGAVLIGDDGVAIAVAAEQAEVRLLASPPPATHGLIEVRNVGILRQATVASVPIALVIRLDRAAPRHVEQAEACVIAGVSLPLIRLYPESPVLALRAELALVRHGLS